MCKCQTRCADLAKRACTLIPCHLFSTLLFTVVQEKPKCYQTNQNMENTYHSEMFFLTWENYQLFLIFPNECSTLNFSFSKGVWGYTSFCIFYRWCKSTFFLTPTIPLALKFSQYLNSSATAYFIDGAIFGAVNKHRPVANLSKILEVIWSTTYNLAKKHAHKLISPL